jgi:hypothetical protein
MQASVFTIEVQALLEPAHAPLTTHHWPLLSVLPQLHAAQNALFIRHNRNILRQLEDDLLRISAA